MSQPPAWIPCYVLLKSPHPENTIYLMIRTEHAEEDILKEQADPGSTYLDYHYNEKTSPIRTYLKGEVVGLMINGHQDDNDAFNFVRAVTIPQVVELLKKEAQEDENFHRRYPNVDFNDESYHHEFMHYIFPEADR